MPLLVLLGRIASHPLVATVLIPSITAALTRFLDRMASRCERSGAVKQAKAAKTAKELRDAAESLTNSTRR